jgi:undecaprenyl-diphosphatase
VAVQTGAMFAVMWEYRARLHRTMTGMGRDEVATRFLRNVAIAFVPAVVFGLALGGLIKSYLFHPVPVACALVVGGFAILWIEARHRRLYGDRDALGDRKARVQTVDDLTAADALKLGLIQCLALVPGTSRSGALIMGGMLLGFSRKAAAEFSFFLGVPTLMGAGAYSLYRQRALLSIEDLPMFGIGLTMAFISALFCIRWLIRYVSSHDFTIFAWYRIVFGLVILLTAWTGVVEWKA